MLVQGELYTITWGPNKQHYLDLGYAYTGWQEEFEVRVEDLPYGSSVKVKVECDWCGDIFETFMYVYSRSLRRTGVSYCCECGNKHFLKDIEEVRQAFIDRGYTPLFTDYKDQHQKLEYRCNKHPEIIQTSKYFAIKRGYMGGCRFCGRENAVSKNSGPLNVGWKGGITSANEAARKTVEMSNWKIAVFQRDNFTCVRCGVRGGNIHAHHILSFAQHVEQRTNVDNGATLCIDCHSSTKFNSFHHLYGHKDYTVEDFTNFLSTTKERLLE